MDTQVVRPTTLMHLTPREIDKLILHQAGVLAQKRLARGLRLNYVEAMALIATQLLEFIRDGRSVAELMDLGRRLLGASDVLDGVAEMIDEVQVEGTFPDGTKLVTVHHPIVAEHGDMVAGALRQLPGSRRPTGRVPWDGPRPPRKGRLAPSSSTTATSCSTTAARRSQLQVANRGDRPIQVGSHYHFVETNRALVFDRRAAYGMRLDIPAGTAVRFEPGETKTVTLVAIAGARVIRGGNAWASGPVVGWPRPAGRAMSHHIDRRHYADIYGPTTGDRVRLGDTDLVAEVEADATVYGDECKFGGGKVLRDGMGQAAGVSDERALDCVITNALIIDWTGIRKADVGIKGGRIAGIGKAGNPDVMAGVTDGMVVGVTTEAIAGEGLHPDGRRHRRAHPLHLPAAGVRRAGQRRHDVHRRRHRAGDRHERDHLHPGCAARRADARRRPMRCR